MTEGDLEKLVENGDILSYSCSGGGGGLEDARVQMAVKTCKTFYRPELA
jgi:hypothetical protein